MPKKRALIVHGGLELHQPRQGAEVVAGILDDNGFAVTVTDDYQALVAPDIGDTDLVVPIITGGEMSREAVKPLLEAVKAGTGIAGYHHGLATTFRDCVPFRYMAACYWVAHPGGIITYRVDVTKSDDPIMAGIGSFTHTSEQYYLNYDPAVEVLATTTFTGEHDGLREGVVMPVVFKSSFGKGRVFYSSLGHQAAELALPEVRTILTRGLLWASR
jgi:type 1 glutamine amidotransferase